MTDGRQPSGGKLGLQQVRVTTALIIRQPWEATGKSDLKHRQYPTLTGMKKIKYYYNTNTLRYEKLETPLRVKLLRIFGFVAAAFVTAALISYVAFQFIGSPQEKLLQQQNRALNYD
jgi:hypothetical protein